VPCYRCYFLDSEQHIVDCEVLDQCVSDWEARQIAASMLQQRRQFRGVSVWDRARRVFEQLIAGICVVASDLADMLDAIGVFDGFGVALVS
jgi:hypothetical protein